MSSLFQRFLCAVAIGIATLSVAAAGERPGNGAVVCHQIRTAAQLQAMQNNLAGSYCLANDIDARSIANFVPIGTAAPYFTGQLYGNGHVIRNLTINSAGPYAALIGVMVDGLIQDVGLVNAKVTATNANFNTIYVGTLVAALQDLGGPVTVTRVYSTGEVSCVGGCTSGGLIGFFESENALTDAWSSANVVGDGFAGGLLGDSQSSIVTRAYATGRVACLASHCSGAGGLIGLEDAKSSLSESYASGPVAGGKTVAVGGLVGVNFGAISRSYATGSTHGSDQGAVGSLVGSASDGVIAESYGAGGVSGPTGAALGGLIGKTNVIIVTSTYWDTVTTGQAASAGDLGTGLTTTQLRAALPAGFGNAWGITKALSYPFLNSSGFTSPLASLVVGTGIFTFLPSGQFDASQYATAPKHANGAALATVYTMIARAIGLADNVPLLKNVPTDKYFWHDATQTTTFAGPLTLHATLGPLTNIAAGTQLTTANVIGQMNVHRLAILRGTFTNANGKPVEHWMLGTLYTKAGANIGTVVANDPWTGTQVEINPVSKKIVTPANFALKNFTVDGYQQVTVN